MMGEWNESNKSVVCHSSGIRERRTNDQAFVVRLSGRRLAGRAIGI